ncbi:Enoyl-CoA hydratase/carnithine racemase [Marinobacter segnicrescens]|uniref:3-hydroxyisobutyryl-CoA hydrolase n=1 Tax=Marinobacter segnicrescens TaxID=430453 RepID=A0A1I0E890_9GAMM|nr:enoyl-CoA hydratase/isomerase family protein [Marinobacter segnicrescens]SET40900.1 Enoyl-CoA hydratase/carnithine racemase [Marinobacter segnicrescens]
MSDNQPEVIVEVRGRYGYLTLNRPKGLNALTLGMVQAIHRQLDSWAGDDAVEAVVFLGAGDKAFCAGGDIRALYDSYQSGDTLHRVFFEEEYSLDQAIHQYPKPVLSVMNGIVMGGGMGVAQGASLRIVSDRAKLAMPETGIGYFPDVGATYFLGRLPGRLGEYLAVTGTQLNAADAIYAGLADLYIPEGALENLGSALAGAVAGSDEAVKAGLGDLQGDPGKSRLATLQPAIDEHFAKADLKAVRDSLRQEQRPEFADWARDTLKAIEGRSPIGMAVALELVRRGRDLSLPQAFELELALDYLWFDKGDIVEGIRALIVDKDKSPQWRVPSIDDLKPEQVSVFFDEVRG